ncbi:MAG: low molecular weight protein arginine phosphatase [bacterium]
MKPFKIVFVCTGNTCRSPMAQIMMQHMLSDEKRQRFDISSAGLFAMPGQPITRYAAEVLQELGMDLKEHCSSMLNEQIIKSADIILVMTESHKRTVISNIPQAANITYTLSEYALGKDNTGIKDIDDPFGGNLDTYRVIRDQIRIYLKKIAEKI